MSFWANWSDGKKWVMGIVSALVIAGAVAGVKSLSGSSEPTRTTIPGDTGWVFAGYFDVEREVFTEGPYVEVVSSTKRGMRQYVEVGDVVRLGAARPVIIVDYASKKTEKHLVSPIAKGIVGPEDQAGVTLPSGTELVVRDISEGRWPGNQQAALWLRVVIRPR